MVQNCAQLAFAGVRVGWMGECVGDKSGCVQGRVHKPLGVWLCALDGVAVGCSVLCFASVSGVQYINMLKAG